MRRGLISWSKAELPERVLDARVARAQAAMAQGGIDALVIYSDPSRSAGASWFTAFVPYWNRGLMVLPRTGKPTLLTAMSNRVHGWIKSNAHLEAVTYSTALGEDCGKVIAGQKSGAVVAIPNLDAVPGDVVHGIGASVASIVDGTALMEKLRAPADPTELAMYFKAASIAHAELAQAKANEKDAAALIGAVEGEARRLGAEEIYVALAPDLAKSRALYRLEGTAALADRFALRVSVAYKGTWVRMARTLSRSDVDEAAAEQFAAAVAALPKTDALSAFATWSVEGCRATQPLELLASSLLDDRLPIAPATVVSVQATIEGARGATLVGAPVLVARAGEASSCLVQPQFDD